MTRLIVIALIVGGIILGVFLVWLYILITFRPW